MTDSQLRVDPSELLVAAADLDRIAERLEHSVTSAGHTLQVAPQGRDEVSIAAADSFSTVAETFGADAASGVHELRKIAAVLRAQAAGFTQGDDDAASMFRVPPLAPH
ncbi:PE family protein [Gordonia sp. ABSL49_1]|uniref:PE family protein n=1 Tax=unclassified Gordonia (in: high G+C Gram-positive bacteria) TaxID=2657482 RepID=UPI001F0D97CA|nr:PE family protein [Gordonia sp. ABSL49_1]MCH5642228.1 PE family protein [Gordonia sp. ABSL49_1]